MPIRWLNINSPSHYGILIAIEWGVYRVQEAAGAGSPRARTSRQGRCLGTGGPPTGRTHPPSHRSGWAAGGQRIASQWRRTQGAAPSSPPPPASCWGRSCDLGSPEERQTAALYLGSLFFVCKNINRKISSCKLQVVTKASKL